MLSQAEIDALLGAVSAPNAEDVLAGTATATTSPAAAGRKVKPYDFRRPDKFSKDQLRTLQAIHDNVGRLASGRFSARLRTGVIVQLAGAEQMIFDEYLTDLTLPTELVVLRSPALAGPFLMDFDLGLAYAFLDRTLGGPGRIPSESREPTAIEANLFARSLEDVLPAITEAWGHLAPFRVEIVETALRPTLLRVAAPSDVVAVLTFEVRIAGQTAPITICYPHAALELLMPRLSATAWYAQPAKGPEAAETARELRQSLDHVALGASATLGSADIPVEVLAALEPGDVIRLDERADRPVLLSIEDQVQAWARPGRVGDRLALQIVTPLRAVED